MMTKSNIWERAAALAAKTPESRNRYVDFLRAISICALGFGRFERGIAVSWILPSWRLVTGALLICTGLALLALEGVAGNGWLGLRVEALLLTFAGAAFAGVNPLRK